MIRKKLYGTNESGSLPRPSSRELRGRQSVRATFRLSRRSIDTISILAGQLGIKQKSLFDHLIEDMEVLNLIARRLKPNILRDIPRVQRTYVLSRKTLKCLDRTSREFDAPRDALVEFSIRRLLPVIVREREKHQARKQYIGKTRRLVTQGQQMLGEMIAELGEDDPVTSQFEAALRSLVNAQYQMEKCVEKGKIIEAFLK